MAQSPTNPAGPARSAPVATVLLATLFALVSAPALAQDSVWIGGTGTWGSAFNWLNGLTPSSGRNTVIANGGTARIAASTGNAFTNDLSVGYNFGQSGAVEVTGTGTLTASANIFVGSTVSSGSMTISAGGTVVSGGGYVGDAVNVSGAGSRWRSATMLVDGTLTIDDGATVHVNSGLGPIVINPSGRLHIGQGGSSGNVSVSAIVNDGELAFDHTNDKTIADRISGAGKITKSGAASTTTLRLAHQFTGAYSVQAGVLDLTAPAHGSDYLASDGGTLRLGDLVDLNQATIRAGAGGIVEYQGATVRGGFLRGPGVHAILPDDELAAFTAVTTFNSTNVVQDGAASFTNFTHGGALANNAPLVLDGGVIASAGTLTVNNACTMFDVGNNGVLTVDDGGVLDNQTGNLTGGGGSRTYVNSGGVLNLLAGTMLELNGALLVNHGTINGDVNVNYGSLASGAGAYGVVNVNQGGVFEPGASPGIATVQSLRLNGTSAIGAPRLAIELAGGEPGSEYDQVHVIDDLSLSLAGVLDVSLIDGFSPAAGQSFDVLDWGSLNGAFTVINLPSLDFGLVWDASDLYASGVLAVVAAPNFAADFDEDGDVDDADLARWRAGFGAAATHMQGDADGDGDADGADFLTWQRQRGSRQGATEIPEPSTLWRLWPGTALIASFGRQRRRLA